MFLTSFIDNTLIFFNIDFDTSWCFQSFPNNININYYMYCCSKQKQLKLCSCDEESDFQNSRYPHTF